MISLPSLLLLQDLHHLCLRILPQPQPQKASPLFWLIQVLVLSKRILQLILTFPSTWLIAKIAVFTLPIRSIRHSFRQTKLWLNFVVLENGWGKNLQLQISSKSSSPSQCGTPIIPKPFSGFLIILKW